MRENSKSTMKDHGEVKRRLHHLSRAWYDKDKYKESKYQDGGLVDEVILESFGPEGLIAEAVIKWQNLGGERVPQLTVYIDPWMPLWEDFRDVIELMAGLDGRNPTPAAICDLLTSCGIEDATEVDEPEWLNEMPDRAAVIKADNECVAGLNDALETAA